MFHSIFKSRPFLLALFGLVTAVSCTGCGTLHYLLQAGKGQLELSNKARPISEVVQDVRTPTKVRDLLVQVPAIKKFAEQNGLKPTHNYVDYVKINRPAASWIVSACKPLKFESKEWHFPIVGSFPYLGWFDLNDAKNFAKDLRDQGWDVDLRGARAYSTLGWFKDAVLSSMITEGEDALGELVNVIVHESVHATFYIKGQSYLDESIASFVADKLTLVYLDQKMGSDSPEKRAYTKSQKESDVRGEDLHRAYEALSQVYESSEPDEIKLQKKTQLLDNLKTKLQFKRDINNATLIQYRTYNVGMPEFELIYRACGSDWAKFWNVIKTLNEKSFSRPQQEDLRSVLLPLKESCR